ncbi:MAG: pilus assembly protein TadG [Micavibrio aeruginosavorus]|uniref:Pilus assembly protein TadG n=1 Tax=Micavibrio aeruginosavorus TaxID=349221 RepID=A0A2W5N3Q3_9BACT|nr:MAG: pilus assembly protein TadG [Micavibrio aeruginosavorus]
MRIWLEKAARKLQFGRYIQEERATAFVETTILMPVMITLLMGVYDLGQGIIVNQKTIGASQIIGDLVTRERSITPDGLEDIIKAGELALEPYRTETFGYDIASVQFDEDGNPDVLWRVTKNMSPNAAAVASTEGLGQAGEGVVVVTTVYKYDPFFTHFVVDQINMQEVAFLRGRRSSTVACEDCPS